MKGMYPMFTFQELSQDVDWQFQSFLEQCETFIDKPLSGKKLSPNQAIAQDILSAYLALARQFYEQYEVSLQATYELAQQPGNGIDPDDKPDVPKSMQLALDKLVVEWNRVYSVIAAIQTSESRAAKKVIAPLTPVIHAAMRAVGLSPKTFPLVLQFGQTYNMGFFNYIDNFRSLSLPLSALKSPWEWTIFWHELAGERVRLLESAWREFEDIMSQASDLNLTKKELDALLDRHFDRLEDDTRRAALKDAVGKGVEADWNGPDRQSSPKTYDIFQDPLQPLIMLSFDELLVDILHDFQATDQKAAQRRGWSADWLRELFEDSFSVINFPIDFVYIFDQLQRRHRDGGKKLRHPTRKVRLAVAVFLQMQITESMSDEIAPPDGKRIDAFLQNIKSPAKIFNPNKLDDRIDVKMAWAVAKHLRELHDRMDLPDQSKKKLMKILSTAMREYVQEMPPLDEIYKQAWTDLKGLPQVRLNRLSPEEKNDFQPLISQLFDDDRLPKPKSPKYERLAQLEFSYTDFDLGVAGTIKAAWSEKTVVHCPICTDKGRPTRDIAPGGRCPYPDCGWVDKSNLPTIAPLAKPQPL
jgi:hypothetical protein